MEKCKEEPKLFIDLSKLGKMKQKEGTSKLKIEGKACEDETMETKIMNRSLWLVFFMEGDLVEKCD